MDCERWLLSAKDLKLTPSRKAGISEDEEYWHIQLTGFCIEEFGNRLKLSQVCINSALIYMQRFHTINAVKIVKPSVLAMASIFLSAKIENCSFPVGAFHQFRSPHTSSGELEANVFKTEKYLIATLGFYFDVELPHFHVTTGCESLSARSDILKTSYGLATASLLLTNMSLEYKPQTIACACIGLASKWAKYTIPNTKKEWFLCIDTNMTNESLKRLVDQLKVALQKLKPEQLNTLMNLTSLRDKDVNKWTELKDRIFNGVRTSPVQVEISRKRKRQE